MPTAAELGLSEKEYQDAINLERVYNLIQSNNLTCSKCRSSAKEIGEFQFSAYEVQKLQRQKQRHSSGGRSSRRKSKPSHKHRYTESDSSEEEESYAKFKIKPNTKDPALDFFTDGANAFSQASNKALGMQQNSYQEDPYNTFQMPNEFRMGPEHSYPTSEMGAPTNDFPSSTYPPMFNEQFTNPKFNYHQPLMKSNYYNQSKYNMYQQPPMKANNYYGYNNFQPRYPSDLHNRNYLENEINFYESNMNDPAFTGMHSMMPSQFKHFDETAQSNNGMYDGYPSQIRRARSFTQIPNNFQYGSRQISQSNNEYSMNQHPPMNDYQMHSFFKNPGYPAKYPSANNQYSASYASKNPFNRNYVQPKYDPYKSYPPVNNRPKSYSYPYQIPNHASYKSTSSIPNLVPNQKDWWDQ